MAMVSACFSSCSRMSFASDWQPMLASSVTASRMSGVMALSTCTGSRLGLKSREHSDFPEQQATMHAASYCSAQFVSRTMPA